MCGGAQFDHQGKTLKTYFPNPNARLPVVTRSGSCVLIPWGRREQQPGLTPQGGWARRESIQQGGWKRFQPRPVKIAVAAFMEKDTEGNSCWYPLVTGQFIQGLVAMDAAFTRIYAVTEESKNSRHKTNRWPRLITDPSALPIASSRLF